MSVVGLDWNSTRALAVVGPAGDYALSVPLEPPSPELPMMLDLAGSQPIVGGAARRRCRVTPRQVCRGFLPLLGTPAGASPAWKLGRRAFDAAQAVGHVWQKLGLCRSAKGVVLTVPSYLQPAQADLLRTLGAKHKVPVLGSVPAALAVALAGHVQQLWSRSALVVDIDDHALTVALVLAGQDRAHLVETRVFPTLGLRAWQDRLINALADLCVWQTRRDPRVAPQAEQGLFDQLDSLTDACQRRHPIQLAVQASQWYHHLLVQPEQTLAFCSPLVSQVVREVEPLGNIPPAEEAPPAILLTHDAGRLPGLRNMLTALAQAWAESAAGPPAPRRAASVSDDFGEDLMFDAGHESADRAVITVLAPDGPARAAHALAEALRGEPNQGHLASVAPLPLAESVEAGPARLHFQGRDYLLHGGPFTLGWQATCSLPLDAREHPQVAERHCDIVFDRRTFLVFNRCNHGTLVNDTSVVGSIVLHAGDRIRLGAQGPVLRFLGQTPARMYTTA
jgi:hypothetical protein